MGTDLTRLLQRADAWGVGVFCWHFPSACPQGYTLCGSCGLHYDHTLPAPSCSEHCQTVSRQTNPRSSEHNP